MCESNQPEREPRPATGLLVCCDLFFISKVTGTAEALGLRVEVSQDAANAVSKIGGSEYCCVLLDLAMEDLNVAEWAAACSARNEMASIAFGSHVDAERLATARSAGCAAVMPRSQFSENLPAILARYIA